MVDKEAETQVDLAFDLITEVRKIRSDFNIPLGSKVPIIIDTANDTMKEVFTTLKEELVALAKLDENKYTFLIKEPPKNSARIIIQDITAYVPLTDVINKENEYKRINKQAVTIEKQISALEHKLAGPFATKASPEIVAKERERLEELQKKLLVIKEQLEILS